MDRKKQYNYSELRGRIKTVFGTEKRFAKELGMSDTNLSLILNNKAEFSQASIKSSCALLDIKPTQIGKYFFCERS